MSELLDIEIERVDGVDEPATGRKFLLLKAEEPDELVANVQGVLARVEAALKLLAKEKAIPLSEEVAKALNEVAKALELDVTFKARQEDEGYGYAKPKEVSKEENLLESLEKLLDERLALVLELAKQAPVAKSQQPRAQDNMARRLGSGLFTDIVFGGD